MIGRLRGELIYADRDQCLIDVAGVGYEVHLPESTRRQLPAPGQPVVLWCHQLVREDDIRLYGFLTLGERELFEQLLTVSGVGPRAALAVLSTFTPERFRRAIALGEAALLVQIPGVGRRTAERWIVEFRNRYHWTADRADIVQPQYRPAAASGSASTEHPDAPAAANDRSADVNSLGASPAADAADGSLWEQTLAALLALGYSDAEATATLDALTRSGAVTAADSVQQWVRAALRRLSPRSLA